MEEDKKTWNVGVLTISDRVSQGSAEDVSGPLLVSLLQNQPWTVKEQGVVPDEVEAIQAKLKEWADHKDVHLILTTGGTGFSPRDVTPEATKGILEREAPGFVVAMISASLKFTPHAMLSRPAAGTRGKTVIINLPGSAKAVKENFESIEVALPHAVSLLNSVPSASAPAQHHKLDTSAASSS